jgi:hypothetical protein
LGKRKNHAFNTYEAGQFPILVKIYTLSHLKERKEKNCLNCQTTVQGRYCHVCGQENLEPKETVWHLVQHFFNDITHFDGKFFASVKFLLRKPGFLSAEYVAGRRASYLNPIRMYVFTSAFFFIILYSLKSPEEMLKPSAKKENERVRGLPELLKKDTADMKELARTTDEDDKEDLRNAISKLSMEMDVIKKTYGDTTTRKFTDQQLTTFYVTALTDSAQEAGMPPEAKKRVLQALKIADNPVSGSDFFGMKQGQYKTAAEYDSSQQALPDSLRDGWFKRRLMEKLVVAQEEYIRDKERYKEKFLENLLHSFPKILFWSLPFFALILNVLYVRRKKQFYYVDHGIFTIHVYCATFLLLLICMLLGVLSDWAQWGWFKILTDILVFLICIYIMIYLYKAMRGFYKQGRFKTFVKYFITCCLAFVINLILLTIFLVISAIYI